MLRILGAVYKCISNLCHYLPMCILHAHEIIIIIIIIIINMLGTVLSGRLFIVLIMCYNTQLYTISSSELPWQLLYSFLHAQIRLSINFHYYEVSDGKEERTVKQRE